jgi:Asp-tRNA(Asn)/Glu-tRNA(Gln) amidotransferase A subunit family amidase
LLRESSINGGRAFVSTFVKRHTSGSIRVPAACCGIVGLKTTFGLVSLQGVFPVEPKDLDTVGPMAKDVDTVVQGMDLLQNGFVARYRAAVAAKPSAKRIRIGRLLVGPRLSEGEKTCSTWQGIVSFLARPGLSLQLNRINRASRLIRSKPNKCKPARSRFFKQLSAGAFVGKY